MSVEKEKSPSLEREGCQVAGRGVILCGTLGGSGRHEHLASHECHRKKFVSFAKGACAKGVLVGISVQTLYPIIR